jgi:hypothetical protein
MKRIIVVTLLLVSLFACSADEISVPPLAGGVVDAGNYPQSWEMAAPAFETLIPSEQWVAALHQVRTPLGEVMSRVVRK